jgi:hypothetical protein
MRQARFPGASLYVRAIRPSTGVMLEYLSLLRIFGFTAKFGGLLFPGRCHCQPKNSTFRSQTEIESIIPFLLPSLLGAVTDHSTMAPKGQFDTAPLTASSEEILKALFV